MHGEASATTGAGDLPAKQSLPARVVDRVDAELSASEQLQKNFALGKPVADELGKLIDLVVRDYVEFWYGPLSNNRQFVNCVRELLSSLVGDVANRILKVSFG